MFDTRKKALVRTPFFPTCFPNQNVVRAYHEEKKENEKKREIETYERSASRVDGIQRRPVVVVVDGASVPSSSVRRQQRRASERTHVPVQVERVDVARDAVAEDLARDRGAVRVLVAEGLALCPESDLAAVGGDAGERNAGVARDGMRAGVGAWLEHLGHEEVLDALGR